MLNSTKGKKERVGRILQMHANNREELKEVSPATSPRGRPQDATTGDTLCDRQGTRSSSRRWTSRSPSSRSRSSRGPRPTRTSWASALAKLAAEDPTFRVAHRRGVGPDHHQRHGRAPPRDHRRPPEARVPGRRQRRRAAGRLPRDDHQGSRVRGPLHQAERRPRQFGHVWVEARAPRGRQRLRVREQDRRRRRPEGIHPAVQKGIEMP